MTSWKNRLLRASVCALSFGAPAWAGPLVVGSGNEAVIEPPVTHPPETPCVVTLNSLATFGAAAVPYSYTPPTACPGPWAKVVLTIGISLNAGRQFDRSGQLFMGGVPLWFGTTAEPRATLAPSWSFQKDVTDYSALFTTAQTGFLQIANYQSNVYTSTITANATLSFYPATSAYPAPRTADMVLPLITGGGVGTLNTGTDTVSAKLTLPTNILYATLDLYLQGQSQDEFWYFSVPTQYSSELESYGNTAFREGEITVDGVPAGISPIYPWIFTGGIDPYLWQPIPGVQTFDFIASHVDLSPFAGVLSDGNPHTIATSVFNANSYFSATGALRLFLDKNATTVTGSIVKNTLAAPNPNVVANLTTSAAGATTGTVSVTNLHSFTISGVVNGSGGSQVNSVSEISKFASNQVFNVSATTDIQATSQNTVTTIVSSSKGPNINDSKTETLTYPLNLRYAFVTAANGNSTQATSVNQQYLASGLQELNGLPSSQIAAANAITTSDTLFFDSNFNVTGHNAQKETNTYVTTGTGAPCFKRTISAFVNVISAVSTGC